MTLPNIPVCPYSPTPAHEPEQSSYTGFPKALYQLQVIWLSLQFCCSPLLGYPFVGRVRSKLCLLMPSECCLTMVFQAVLKMKDSVKKCPVC